MTNVLVQDFSGVKKGLYYFLIPGSILLLPGFIALQPHASHAFRMVGIYSAASFFVILMTIAVLHLQDKYRLDYAKQFKKYLKVRYSAAAKYRGILQARANDELVILALRHKTNLDDADAFQSSKDGHGKQRASVAETEAYYATLNAKEQIALKSGEMFDLVCGIINRGGLEAMTYEKALMF